MDRTPSFSKKEKYGAPMLRPYRLRILLPLLREGVAAKIPSSVF
jgi:hypothetical protein